MSLAPGTRLGPYEIVAPVGAGGMGEVFRARDTRLDRTVAIKVLAPDVARDPDVRERFEREARTIASLTHPHICTLHDVGHQAGLDYLVLEFVEGETLAARLQSGRLPMDLVLKTAIEIADALDRAHRAGIVHRDLKPGNVMLTRSGAKLLDFGLAKSRPIEGAFAAAETHSITKAGALVGTLQYMAPEQLEGRAVDHRSDIFALGAVIYEMATGRRAFDGANQVSVIGAILHTEPPPLLSLQPLASPALGHVVRRCMAKDPDDRWQSARDVRLELQDPAPPGGEAATAPGPPRTAWSPWWVVGILAALLVAAVAGILVLGRRTTPPAPLVRAQVTPPSDARFTFSGDFAGPAVISPDGRALAFVASHPAGTRQLYVRRLDALAAAPLAGTDGATFPFWSPDSRSVGFFADGRLKRVEVDGGAVLTVCEAVAGRGGAWSADGRILFTPSPRDGLYVVASTGGEPREVTRLDPANDASHRWPEFVNGGPAFLYLSIPLDAAKRDESAIVAHSLDGGPPAVIARSPTQPVVAGGSLFYLRDATLVAQALAADGRSLAGEPLVIAQNVQHDPTIWRGVYTAAPNGPIVYQAGEDGGRTMLAIYDRAGQRLGTVGDPAIYFDVNVSPDGRAVAVNRGDPADIWVYHLARGTATRITSDDVNQSLPVWSPDGTRLVFSAVTPEGRGMLVGAAADGTDSPVAIVTGDVVEASDWSRDGKYLLVKPGDLRSAPGDVWVMPVADPPRQFPLVASRFAEYHARFSPDGRWVAYVSNESGREEVYVTAFAPPVASEAPDARGRDTKRPGRWQVSTAGGVLPRWKGDGAELYYLGPDRRVMAARVEAHGASFVVQHVDPLFQADPKPVGWRYDVFPDGQRFIVDTVGSGQDAPLVVVLNWAPSQR
jgi:Tol biopolymer transport system component/tRNA A-37 threonylcarbamoyl transferase component Bud32